VIELTLASGPVDAKAPSFWRDPAAWMRDKQLSQNYWIFFSAAFFFDAGFAVYYFLFNLFLLDCGYHERQIGWIGGSLTLGSVVGTLPAGVLIRRFGIERALKCLFVAAPLMHVLRVVWIWEPAQIGLAFLSGLVMSGWGVCFLPAVARLTTEKNRTAAFSLIFSVSVGTSMLGGLVCGYLRTVLASIGVNIQPFDVKRLILLSASAIVLLGLIPLVRLRIANQAGGLADERLQHDKASWVERWRSMRPRPSLVRFLLCMALWSALLASFTPFANVYLSRDLHIPIERIGLLFSVVQVIQLCMGLLAPLLFRAMGLVRGIAATQIGVALLLLAMATATGPRLGIPLFLAFSAAQWMSSPGLYNLLMSETPDRERSSAAAMTLFLNALAASGATAASGLLISRFGYPPVFVAIGTGAITCALLFLLVMKKPQVVVVRQPSNGIELTPKNVGEIG
jgi:predicted MFS family arabinose efflux permease